jgi:NAD(P)-dependent dehydrogenase (short-subunit alcohol dehydrogenase family)
MGQQASLLLKSWGPNDIPDLTGKIAVVTGANSGIGYHTALELGRHGAKVIALCRDPTRGKEMLERLRKDAPQGDFELLLADLSSLADVKRAAATINARNKAVDILVNNAGVMMNPKRESTKDGFEMQIGTNHLGHFALTGELLPSLKRSVNPRVVNVSSSLAFAGTFKGGPIDFVVPEAIYNPSKAYGNSKLANLMFTNELAKRHPQITAVAAHPGYSATNLQKHAFGGPLYQLVMQDATVGALPSLRAATAPGLKSGAYYGPWLVSRGAPSQFYAYMPPQARNADLCRSLWDASVEATGVKY